MNNFENIIQNKTNNNSNWKPISYKDDLEKNLREEHYNKLLSLRKKKMNKKILKFRVEFKNPNNSINMDEQIKPDESFISILEKLRNSYQNENETALLLKKISFIIKTKTSLSENNKNKRIFNFSYTELITNLPANFLCELSEKYSKSQNIIELISNIFLYSCLFLIQEDNNNDNKVGYFISDKEYIDTYKRMLINASEKKNYEIVKNMLLFIGKIADDSPENQKILYKNKIIEIILKFFDINEEIAIIKNKIWCLSLFDLQDKFAKDCELSLKIQKIYLLIFDNIDKLKIFDEMYDDENDENNTIYNFFRLIANTSYCNSQKYINNLFERKILNYLIECGIKDINSNCLCFIVDIFGNLTNANTEICQKLIDIGMIQFLIAIITNKNKDKDLRGEALWPINNLLTDYQIYKIVLFEQNTIKAFCILLDEEIIYFRIFKEVCYGLINVLEFLNNEEIKIIIEKYFIIQLLVKAFKNFMNNENSNCGNIIEQINYFLTLIYKFLTVKDIELIKNHCFIFQKQGGEEILEKCANYIDSHPLEKNKEIENIIKNIFTLIELEKKIIEEISVTC